MVEEKGQVKTPIVIAIVVVVAIVVALGTYFVTRPGEPAAPLKLKAGFLVTCDETDMGWSAMGIAAARSLEERYGWEVDVTYYVTYVDGPRVVRDYAARGYDLIWAHGGEYEDAVHAVAEDYPDTYFAVFNATKTPPANVVGFLPKMREGAYLAGVLAGKMTKTNAIADVVGEWYPWGCMDFYAFAAGAKSVNPDVKAYARAAGTWADAALGRELAFSLMDMYDVDIMMQEADITGRGVITAVEERGIYHVGTYLDQSVLAPEATLTSILVECSALARVAVENILAGTFEEYVGGKILTPGLAEGATGLASFHRHAEDIPQSVKDLLEATERGIIDGTIVVPDTVTTEPPPDE